LGGDAQSLFVLFKLEPFARIRQGKPKSEWRELRQTASGRRGVGLRTKSEHFLKDLVLASWAARLRAPRGTAFHMSHLQAYRADIQGLRALAVAPVVLYHVDSRVAPGGFVGVDIFFVISGYLITRILLRELAAGRFSVAGFYERRVKRLFPALYAMLAATLAVGAVVLSPGDLAQLGRTAAATVLFSSNIMFLDLSGYFDGAAELKPLLHTWSLAVEEQFYLAFPLVLAAIWRFAPRRLGALLWGGALVSFVLCVMATRNHQAAAFYLPLTRAWELLLGAILAAGAAPALRGQRARDVVSLVGLALIGASLVLIDKTMRFPGAVALAPALGAALVIQAGQGGHASLGGRLLSVRPLTALGAISYSLYLWHWPALVYARYLSSGEPAVATLAAAAGASALLAVGSYHFIEQPALRAGFSLRGALAAGGGVMAGGLALSIALVASGGLPQRFPASTLRMFAGEADNSPHRARCHSDHATMIAYERNCVFGAAGATPSLAVWGDSFGAELAVALGEAAAGQGRAAMQITASACPPGLDFALPIRPKCADHNRRTLERLSADARIDTVVMVANFSRYAPDVGPMLRGFDRAAEALRAAGKHVVVTYPIPAMPQDAPRVVGLLANRGADPSGFGTPRDRHDADMSAVVASLDALTTRTGAARFTPASVLCRDGLCPGYRPGDGVLYFDAEHLSLTGARLVVSGAQGLMATIR
jgi:peptidoglycan/LPS O-acetylase OafA/YrhL